MGTIARTQTAFRLKNSLLERLKENARRTNKSLNAYVEDALEDAVSWEPEYPKLPKECFEKGRIEAEKYVLKDCRLPKEYEGLDAFEQAALDKEFLYQALYEDNC